jgi:hypothetical protein
VSAVLAECFAELLRLNGAGVRKPTLVLAGDVLDLALSPREHALSSLEKFLRAVMPPGSELFGDIVYIPGNHDHSLWHAARETQYLNHLARMVPGEPLDEPWDATKVFMNLDGEDRLASGLLTAISRRLPNLAGSEVLMAYPNFGVWDRGLRRAVVFHHGHFIEPAACFFSTFASLFFPGRTPPPDVYTLEKENSAWIDFLWSTMGSCGQAGSQVESVYEMTGDARSLAALMDTVASSVAHRYPVPQFVPHVVREWMLKAALRQLAPRIVSALERRQGDAAPLSVGATAGLHSYIDVFLRRQFDQEEGGSPESLTFVLGHTHKPGVTVHGAARILNTGGWVVDGPEIVPVHGAAAVLVDDGLRAVNVRWYNEGSYAASVEEPLLPGEAHSALYHAVEALLRARPQPWRMFGETVQSEVLLRLDARAGRLKAGAAGAV